MSQVDAHAHVFGRRAATSHARHPSYGALLAELMRVGQGAGATHFVLTQPSFLGHDNSLILSAAAADPEHVRAIAWLAPDTDPAWLAEPGLAGLRFPLMHDGAIDWSAYADLLSVAHELGLHVEIGARGAELISHLDHLLGLGLRVVVEHMGLFDAAAGPVDDPTFAALRERAGTGQVWVKLSAPYQADVQGATAAARLLLEAFGPERLLWGSDWPHVSKGLDRATAYGECLAWLRHSVGAGDGVETILWRTPASLYGFNSK